MAGMFGDRSRVVVTNGQSVQEQPQQDQPVVAQERQEFADILEALSKQDANTLSDIRKNLGITESLAEPARMPKSDLSEGTSLRPQARTTAAPEASLRPQVRPEATAPVAAPTEAPSAAQFGIVDQQQPQQTTPQVTNSSNLSILDFISKGEGGYNSSNRGTRNKKIVGSTNNTSLNGKPLTESTIGEIMQAQREGLFAVGRYQMIPTTFKLVVEQLGLPEDAVFTPEVQDRMGLQLLLGDKRPKLAAYLRGEDVSIDTAMREFAKEWASVPDPSTGESYYAGTGNKASHSVAETRAILEATREQLAGQQ